MTGSRAQVIMEKQGVSLGVTNHVPGFMGFLTSFGVRHSTHGCQLLGIMF